jgi:hypothetical protein
LSNNGKLAAVRLNWVLRVAGYDLEVIPVMIKFSLNAGSVVGI